MNIYMFVDANEVGDKQQNENLVNTENERVDQNQDNSEAQANDDGENTNSEAILIEQGNNAKSEPNVEKETMEDTDVDDTELMDDNDSGSFFGSMIKGRYLS